MDAVNLQAVEKYIEEIESKPSLLGHTSLSFFRDYLTSLGCELPISAHKRGKRTMREVVDVERTDEDAAEAEVTPPEQRKDYASQAGKSMAFEEARSKAMTAIRERNFEEAVKHFSLAISIDPASSLMYCARANVHNKLGNPEAAIDDATVALQINPKSTRGRESLKMAYEMLGLPDPEEDELLPSATAEKRKKKMKI